MKLVTIMKNERWMATFSLMPLSRVTSLFSLSLRVIAFPFLHLSADPNTWGFIACMAWHSLCTEALCSFTSSPLFVTEVKDEYKQSRWKTALQINVIWDFINLPLSPLPVIYMPIPVCYFLLCLSAGAHLNPAVTLSFCVLEKAPWGKLVPYSLSQLLGAYVASGLVYLVYYGMSVCHLKSFITWQIFSEEFVYDCDALSSLSNRLLDSKQAELFINSKCVLKANEKSEKLYSLSWHVKRLTELSVLHRNKCFCEPWYLSQSPTEMWKLQLPSIQIIFDQPIWTHILSYTLISKNLTSAFLVYSLFFQMLNVFSRNKW